MQYNQYTNVTDSKIVDPVVQLLEDIRTRKTKVTIPGEDDIIYSIWNDPTVKNRIPVQVEIGSSSFKFEKPNKIPKLFQNTRSPEFPTAQQKIILKRLQNVPAYVVVTNRQEIITASPRDPQNQPFFNWIYTKYYNWFVWREDHGPITIALFFLDKEDAELYLHEVGKLDHRMAEKKQIKVGLTNLGAFYKLNRTSAPGHQAKLVADLDEINKVISKYVPKHLHEINPKQKHSKNSYQGNPIYILRTAIGKKGSKKQLINYKIDDGDGHICTRNIFFKLEDAYLAWDKFCFDNKDVRISLRPNIEIYNLESYLLDLESRETEIVTDNYFLATQKAFKNLETELENNAKPSNITFSNKLKRIANQKSNDLKDFCKGIIWVLTSDTLPTEDNAW